VKTESYATCADCGKELLNPYSNVDHFHNGSCSIAWKTREVGIPLAQALALKQRTRREIRRNLPKKPQISRHLRHAEKTRRSEERKYQKEDWQAWQAIMHGARKEWLDEHSWAQRYVLTNGDYFLPSEERLEGTKMMDTFSFMIRNTDHRIMYDYEGIYE